MSLRTHLAGLDAAALTMLLRHRPDMLVEPVPRDVGELAHRLNGVESLSRALPLMDYDEIVTARAIALATAGPGARAVVDRLCARGLAWEVDGRVGLPERLALHFAQDVGGFRPLDAIARQARVDDLAAALAALGGDPAGLTKPRLTEHLTSLLTDPDVVARAVEGLAASARRHLDALLGSDGYDEWGGGSAAALHRAGLLISGPYHRPELPREVAVALLLDGRDPITGRPDLPASTDRPDDGRAAADAAVLSLTALLDVAGEKPLATIKKGGVGSRERTRLATKLGIADAALWIDIAHAAGLLAGTAAGYAPTAEFARWRESTTAARWADAAQVWFALECTPTSREIDDGEVAPPLPLGSTGGLIRRALLRAAAGGRSVRAAAERIDWFCPLHHYDAVGLERKLAATLHEARVLGVVVGDRLSALGELLVDPDDLAARAAELLPQARGLLVLQSDLTALVSGQASAEAARLLGACAVPEGRGVAATWRFSPASVRAALDAGWDADDLRARLGAVSGRDLPQPLDYLLTDVARRHGSVRLRATRSCVTGSEAEITEILHTRSLAAFELRRLAPTVLTSTFELDKILPKLRAAGFSPMPEDTDGVVIVPERATTTAPATYRRPSRERVDPAELAARLQGAAPGPTPVSETHARLAALAPHLDPSEVSLLADALEHGRDVHIHYSNSAGNHSERTVAPKELWEQWLSAWCHLRSAEREFTVAGIEAVSPA